MIYNKAIDPQVLNAYMLSMTLAHPLKRGDLRNALVAYAEAKTKSGAIDAMSLRAAARDLGVSSGAVYRHFCDKDDLMKEVVYRGVINLRDLFRAIRPEGAVARSPDEAIGRAFAFGRLYFEFAGTNPTLWRLMCGRIGNMCKQDMMQDDALRKYTIFDVASQNMQDLFVLGLVSREPNIQDTRFNWSALHGAADLTQSGARLDSADRQMIADETVRRCLLSLGCAVDVIDRHAPPDATFS